MNGKVYEMKEERRWAQQVVRFLKLDDIIQLGPYNVVYLDNGQFQGQRHHEERKALLFIVKMMKEANAGYGSKEKIKKISAVEWRRIKKRKRKKEREVEIVDKDVDC